MRKILVEFVIPLSCGVLGGVIGGTLVYWLRKQGLYAAVLPGALAGLGSGMLARTNSNLRGFFAALLAALAGLMTEWLVFFLPREKTLENFVGFLKEFPSEPPITKIFLGLGLILGFWWGRECTFRGRLIEKKSRIEPE
jgi:hypothetical protein